MFNNGGSNPNSSNASYNEDSKKVSEKLRICMYLLFSLAFFRVFCLQFYGIISDLIAAFIVYCTYIGRGRIMAMFCLINAFLGIIYSIAIGSMDLSKLNKPQIQRNPYNDYNNNNNPNYFNNQNNNLSFQNNAFNYNNNIPNKNIYGINDLNNKSNSVINNNKNNDPNYNYGNSFNNNYDNFGNPINDNNNNPSESRSFSFVYILSVTIYSVVVYSVLSFYSYKAFDTYKFPFGEMAEDPENQNAYYNGQNYGGIDMTRNTSNNNRRSANPSPSANNNRNFVPFGGSGQRLGE